MRKLYAIYVLVIVVLLVGCGKEKPVSTTEHAPSKQEEQTKVTNEITDADLQPATQLAQQVFGVFKKDQVVTEDQVKGIISLFHKERKEILTQDQGKQSSFVSLGITTQTKPDSYQKKENERKNIGTLDAAIKKAFILDRMDGQGKFIEVWNQTETAWVEIIKTDEGLKLYNVWFLGGLIEPLRSDSGIKMYPEKDQW